MPIIDLVHCKLLLKNSDWKNFASRGSEFSELFPKSLKMTTSNDRDCINWLLEVERAGGELSWILKKDYSIEWRQTRRTRGAMIRDVLSSSQIKNSISEEAERRGVTRETVHREATEILLTMAADFHLRTAVQPIGYVLVKAFKRLFSGIFVNLHQFEKLKSLIHPRIPIVFVPTHKSYLDFLIISLLAYVGEVLRRCGAFFIKRSFKNDSLYWSVFAEYVQQILTKDGRPLEFFIEGQRSRTSKSLYPRSGLLNVVLEPFFRCDLVDMIFVPVTINYERILEESLYAFELLGVPKPKETASGLFKARQILGDSYGNVFVTVGEPISVREYFLSKTDILEMRDPGQDLRANLSGDSFTLSDREKSAIQAFSLNLVETHNRQNQIGLWPIMCLTILQMLSSGTPFENEFNISLEQFSTRLKRFLHLFESLGIEVFRYRHNSVDEEIHRLFELHKTSIALTTTNSPSKMITLQKTASFEGGGKFVDHTPTQLLERLPSLMMLSNYSNIAINSMINVSLVSLCCLKQFREDEEDAYNGGILISRLYETFEFLREMLNREFVYNPENLRAAFEDSLTKMNNIKVLLIREDFCFIEWSSSTDIEMLNNFASVILPFVKSYYMTIENFISNLSDGSIRIQSEMVDICRQQAAKHYSSCISQGQQPNSYDVVTLALSLSGDLIKNLCMWLKSKEIVKVSNEGKIELREPLRIKEFVEQLSKFVNKEQKISPSIKIRSSKL